MNHVFSDVSSIEETALEEFFNSLSTVTLRQWLVAAGVLLVLFLISHLLVRLLVRKLNQSTRISKSLHAVLVTVVRFALILISFMVAGNLVGIPVSAFLVIFAVLGTAITLAAQGVLNNIAGCLILLSGKIFEVGDYIETPNGSGTVQEINLLNTKLLSYEGATIYIPNSVLYTEAVTNQSSYQKRRANITFRVSAKHDPASVREAAMEAVSKIPCVLDDPAPLLVVSGYTAGHVNYTLLAWAAADSYWPMRNGLTEQLYFSFQKHGIEMTDRDISLLVSD